MRLLDILLGRGDPKNQLLLPGRRHQGYSYPDMLVSMSRMHFGDMWNGCRSLLHDKQQFMLTIRQFVDFLILLNSGKAFDARGKRVQKSYLDKLLAMICVWGPPRGEWLDAVFDVVGTNYFVTYHKIDDRGQAQKVTEPLEECLMEDQMCGLVVEDWLKNATSQGLPGRTARKSIVEDASIQRIEYKCPRKISEAYFFAGLGWSGLRCNVDLTYTAPEIGVRAARIRQ